MQNLLKNKFLIILTLFIILLCFITTNCFASDNSNTITLNLTKYKLTFTNLSINPSDYEYYFLYYGENDAFWLFLTHTPIEINGTYGSDSYTIKNQDGFLLYNYSGFSGYENTFNTTDLTLDYTVHTSSISISDISSGTKTIPLSTSNFTCNHDVLKGENVVYSSSNSDTSVSVVFQVAPQTQTITKVLMEQTEKVGMTPLELVKTVLPIVIVTIVGLIAFWKSWQFLLKQLRNG